MFPEQIILCNRTWKNVTDSIIPIASATRNVISSPYHGFPRTIVKNIDILLRFSTKSYGLRRLNDPNLVNDSFKGVIYGNPWPILLTVHM